MITVEQALAACLALAKPLEPEWVDLADCNGRVLRSRVTAQRDQPPFAASAMDGYALSGVGAVPGAVYVVVGEAAAGHIWTGAVGPGQCVRIFTGAPVPQGADRIIIQEDVIRDGDQITLGDTLDLANYVRPSGGDFAKGSTISAPRRLRPTDLALAAAMNQPRLQVGRKPIVALIATGDELVQPGETPRPDQIIASNTYGLKAMIEAEGGLARVLPIAKDTVESLSGILSLAQDADLIVTIGGASVGDHDLVAQVAGSLGLERAFYKIAMRPGKPLMAGRLGQAQLLGLPGNPVSSMVCGHLFLVPMIHAYLGLPTGPRATKQAILAEDLGPNGPRQHYMRAQLSIGDGLPVVTPFERQDSSLISVLAGADALMIRPANQAALSAGALVDIIPL